jgi:hypothetical protein
MFPVHSYTAIWVRGTLQDAKISDVQPRVQCGHQIIARSQPAVATMKPALGTELGGVANS